jgi:hypothetical protein
MVRHGPFFMPQRPALWSALLLMLGLTACIPQPSDRHLARPRPSLQPDSAMMRQCTADLTAQGARYRVLPDYRNDSGCSAINAVALSAAGASIANLGATRCPLASAFVRWVKGPVQQAAQDVYRARVARVVTMGSYSCRQVRGVARASLSEHAFANAIDVSGFVLTNGRTVTVATGWTGAAEDEDFLRRIRKAACQRFQTVLSPDYNVAHRDHLHLDLGRGPYCR